MKTRVASDVARRDPCIEKVFLSLSIANTVSLLRRQDFVVMSLGSEGRSLSAGKHHCSVCMGCNISFW